MADQTKQAEKKHTVDFPWNNSIEKLPPNHYAKVPSNSVEANVQHKKKITQEF
jgi:hypothetical protein